MNKKIDIKFISKIGKPKTENVFLNALLNILMLILFPIIIILGLIFFVIIVLLSFLQNLFSSKTENQTITVSEINPETNPKINQITLENQWNIFSSTKQIKLYQKYSGEVRFGQVYLNLKSEPSIEKLYGKIFGDWFYIYKNGIFLQQWNATNKPNTNLIFINSENFEIEIIKQNIPSVLWEMKLSQNENLELICDTGYEILKYEIEVK